MTDANSKYRAARMAHWNRVAAQKNDPHRAGAFYQQLLEHYYCMMVQPGLRVLELGCGGGDLLAALKPSFGVGVDFSAEMIDIARSKHPECRFVQADVHEQIFEGLENEQAFDVIILSDLINDLWDVQTVFENMRSWCHPRTHIIINFYSNLWKVPLGVVKHLGKGANLLHQNWLTQNDVINLLKLAGFETINDRSKILLPLRWAFLTTFFNRFLANIIPFRWFCLTNFIVARPSPDKDVAKASPSVSVIVAARNEAGNIEDILRRVPSLGSRTQLVFVEGHSTDNTYETIEGLIKQHPEKDISLYRQPGKGKGDAVRLGFDKANGDILMILDADMTVPPEDLPRFVDVIVSGKGEFINGVRLVYPMEDKAMRFFNILGNKFFSLAYSWLLEQPIKDTLCGTKVMWAEDYQHLAANRSYFGDFDPFGDFDLLFGAAKLNLKIAEMPVRYRSRIYGDTNIQRWRHGWLLLKMVAFAARRIKFI
ncbi:MAG: bifunctional class I SAM-dependent methyltransferase/glycosyltransferase family 2 protein [Desulfobacteraceae bacterium]|jgi:2-polyprenyl-3-methyl-5-hydroxy-6-metoxy-1,4-benzoquinol methylase|nr:bifunctional class I SAM-dependent methyltransferase/glycosyltransferase family 2 protein [Desulfobacteraceae bacterium]